MNLEPIYTNEQYDAVMPQAMQWLDKAHKYTPECSVESTLENIENGTEMLWCIRDDYGDITGVVTTIVRQFPNYPIAVIRLCGGVGVDEWIHLISDIEHWARGHGCRYVEIQGRKGWAKKLPKEYKAEAVIYQKEINHV